MNIVYVGAFRLPNLDAAAPRVLTIGKMLRDLGHNVSYLAWGGQSNDNNKESGVVDGFKYQVSNELKVLSNPFSMLQQWYYRGSKSLKILEETSGNIDLIIAYQPSYFFLRRLKRLCNKRNIKLAVDITEWYDNKELRLLDRPFNYINMAKELKKIDNKILISSHLANYYQGKNDVVIPATTDLSEAKWSSSKAQTFPRFDGLTFIYAGTPTFKDKLHVVVKTLNQLIQENFNIRFYIFGCTQEQYSKHYPGEISEKISFMGTVPQDDIPGYYHQSDYMILLRDRNRKNMMGFPTKFAEAISAGIPVITNDTSDISKYLKNNENGLIVSKPNSEGLYNVLKDLLSSDPKTVTQSIKEISKLKSAQLDYKNFISKMNSFISNL